MRRTLSIEEDTVPVESAQMSISVTAAMMQTDDSGLIWLRHPSSEVKASQDNNWEFFIASREATLSPVMFRVTFASPMMVKSLNKDMMIRW